MDRAVLGDEQYFCCFYSRYSDCTHILPVNTVSNMMWPYRGQTAVLCASRTLNFPGGMAYSALVTQFLNIPGLFSFVSCNSALDAPSPPISYHPSLFFPL